MLNHSISNNSSRMTINRSFLEEEGTFSSGIFIMTSSICLSLLPAETLFSLSDFLYKILLDLARRKDFLNSWMYRGQSLLCQGTCQTDLSILHPLGALDPMSPSAGTAAS